MRFRFINVGPLKEVELDVRPLTIIGGVNQVGKSFITKFLYGILATKASPTEEKERADKFKRIFQQGDFRKLKNRYYGELGLVSLEDRIMFLTVPNSEEKEELLRNAVENEPENFSLIFACARFLRQKGDYEEAKKYIEKAIVLQEDDEESFEFYIELLFELGKLEEAVEVAKKVLGERFHDEASENTYRGKFYDAKGDYDNALEFYTKALEIQETVLGENHIETATSYVNIGAVYHAKGEYDKALEFFLRALAIQKETLGENHYYTATSYNNIGQVYHSKGDYNKAFEFYSKSLNIVQEVLGRNHLYTARSYNSIGSICRAKGQYHKALEFHYNTLSVMEEVFGENHPDTANCYNNIGEVYYEQGKYDKALEFYFKSLAVRKEKLGEDHRDTAASYNNIGLAYNSEGEYDKAFEFLSKSLEIDKAILGESHRDVATGYNNLGLVHSAKGEHDKALEFYFKALEIIKIVQGENYPNTAMFYYNIGTAYHAKANYDKALEFWNKALEIREKVLGENDPSTIQSYRVITELYIEQGNKEKALKYLKKIKAQGDSAERETAPLKISENSKEVIYISSPVLLDTFRAHVSFRDEGKAGVSDIYGDFIMDIVGTGEPLEEIILSDLYQQIEQMIAGKVVYDMQRGFRFIKGEDEFTIDSTASGIKLFGILQMLIERNLLIPNAYLLLEEPENHLHPSLRFKFMDLINALVDKGVYVIITTHSPEIVRDAEYLINTKKLNPTKCSFLNLTFNEDKRTSSGKSQSTEKSLEDITLSLTDGFYKLVLAEEMKDEEILNTL